MYREENEEIYLQLEAFNIKVPYCNISIEIKNQTDTTVEAIAKIDKNIIEMI